MSDDAPGPEAQLLARPAPMQTSPRRRRLVLACAAVAVVVAVVVTVIIQFSPLGGGRSAMPGDDGYPQGPMRITGVGYLQQRPDRPPVLCLGGVGESSPAYCHTTVPVTGLDWGQVPGAVEHGETIGGEATVTGLWQDGVLAVESVGEAFHPEQPANESPAQLCEQPATTPDRKSTTPDRKRGHDHGPDRAPLEGLAGFQASWVTYPDGRPAAGTNSATRVVNIATTGDRGETERVARQSYAGPLCVGSIPGPAHSDLLGATERLHPRFDELGILFVAPGMTEGRTGISVGVFIATDGAVSRIHDAVGADIAPWTTVRGQFRQV